MEIRPMKKNDIPFAMRLTISEGWSSIPLDFGGLLRYDSTAAFVPEKRNERLGMVSAVSYGSFGFMGNLIVEKEQTEQMLGMCQIKAVSYSGKHSR